MADDDDGYGLDLYFALDEVTLESHRHLVPSNKDDELNHNNSSNKDDYEYDLSLFLSDDFPYDTTNTESTETIFKSPQKDKFEEKTERRENQQKLFAILIQIREWGNTDILDEQQYRTWRALHDHREQMKQAKKTRRAARRAALHGAPRVELHGAPRVELHGTLRIDIIKHVVRMTCNYFIGFVCRFVVLCRVLCQIANRNDRMNVQNILFMCGFLYKIYRIFLLCKTII